MALTDLNGVKAKTIGAGILKEPSSFDSILDGKTQALTMSDENGAINVWVHDDGRTYQADMLIRHNTAAAFTTDDPTEMHEWLEMWIPMTRPNKTAADQLIWALKLLIFTHNEGMTEIEAVETLEAMVYRHIQANSIRVKELLVRAINNTEEPMTRSTARLLAVNAPEIPTLKE